ncbi:MAG: DUF2934 domain-containing protein [Alphaproteobacteria bacterium]|nr:DUF2934 domain-containing protein [Alphaproteobacteria bacterium]
MQADKEARIRERAYAIWVAEGREHGKHDEHWRRAAQEVEHEDSTRSGAKRGGKRGTGPAEAGPAPGLRSRPAAPPTRAGASGAGAPSTRSRSAGSASAAAKPGASPSSAGKPARKASDGKAAQPATSPAPSEAGTTRRGRRGSSP